MWCNFVNVVNHYSCQDWDTPFNLVCAVVRYSNEINLQSITIPNEKYGSMSLCKQIYSKLQK